MAKSPIPLPTADDEILVLLRLFNEQAGTLFEYDFHREACGLGSGFEIKFGPGQPESATRKGASQQMTSATILVLRKLVQQQDKISFPQLVEMHQRLPIPDRKKQMSAKQLDILAKYLEEPTGYSIKGWTPTRGDLFEVFMYGKFAHNKQEHIAKYNDLMNCPFAVMLESDFEDIVLTYIEVALWYKSFNESILLSLDTDKTPVL